MDAPQSRAEIDPIETAIRQQIDDLLRIRWNPRSYVTRPGGYDVYGLPIPPQYEGRWEVVRDVQGVPAVIYQVRWDGDGCEAYRAVGWWLLDFLKKWDRANQHWIEEQRRMLAEEELALEHIREDEDEEAREFWDRAGFQLATTHGGDGRESWFVPAFGTPSQPKHQPEPV